MKQNLINATRMLALVMVGLLFTACPTIYVSHHTEFPADKFEAAFDRIAELQADNPKREGEAYELNILVYDGNGGELVQVSMPLAVLELGVNVAQETVVYVHEDEWEEEFGTDFNPLANMSPEDLRKMGPGLLVQVEDAEEDTHVLIWLE